MKDEALAARCRALQAAAERRRRRDDGRHGAAAARRRRGEGVPHPRRPRQSCWPTARGCAPASLSGRSSEVVSRRAAELGWPSCARASRDKGAALRAILAEQGLRPEEVAYIGDDVNDLPVLTEVGLSAAPADAPLEVRLQAFMVTEARGGRGCLREFVEAILRARGEWDEASPRYGAACRVSRGARVR